jgi:hypothetical protein
MTKKEYILIATCIKNFKKRQDQVLEEQSQDTFDEIEFLINEFAYALENNTNFNEKKFREFIHNQ